MNYAKENLKKLLILIEEILDNSENEWFKSDLLVKIKMKPDGIDSSAINDIYEYCIRKIITEHAVKFYEDFKLIDIKDKLISDFIRMEQFRREDNFEDFCLALFQQIEGIVNRLVNSDLQAYIIEKQNIETHKAKDKLSGSYETQKLWQLLFNPHLKPLELEKKLAKPIIEWDFTEKYKAVLYEFYFNYKIHNYRDFQIVFFLGNELYQSRNLNHRGGKISENQQKTIDKVKSNIHKYYFKFLGFLEDFTSKINLYIK